MNSNEQILLWFSQYRKEFSLPDNYEVTISNIIHWLAEKELTSYTPQLSSDEIEERKSIFSNILSKIVPSTASKIIKNHSTELIEIYSQSINLQHLLYSELDLKAAYNNGESSEQLQEAGLEARTSFESWLLWYKLTNKR